METLGQFSVEINKYTCGCEPGFSWHEMHATRITLHETSKIGFSVLAKVDTWPM